MNKKYSAFKFKIIMILLFFILGLLMFFTIKYASQNLQWLNIIFIIFIFIILGAAAFACPNCYKWFTIKEIGRIELARSKGGSTLKLGTLEYFDWISPKATEEDKIMLINLASTQNELFGSKENLQSRGSSVIWSKICRITMQCSNCKYKLLRYNKSSQALSVQIN